MLQKTVKKPAIRPLLVCIPLMLGMYTSVGSAAPLSVDNFELYGDFRARLEYDWDSMRGSGVERDDRGRLRVRARLGVNYTDNDRIKVGFRLRTGSDDSQQSPHITIFDFDDNPTGDADVNFDKWFFEFKAGGTKTWVGRNSMPWWHFDEMGFDDDVIPAGLGFTWDRKVGDDSKFQLNAGVFTLPEGMQNFRGDMVSGQLVYDTTLGGVGLTVAGGYVGMDADPLSNPCPPGVPEGTLGCQRELYLQGNGNRDYSLLIGNVQLRFKELAGKPLNLGLDLLHNTESYSSATDAFTQFHKDNDTGWTASILWGSTKKNDWLLGYYYTHQEMLALNNSFTQDDWVRWGNATQTRASNIKGSEFRVGYGLADNMNLLLRVYLVDGIDLTNPGDTTKEDGNRARLDLNYKFK